MGWHTESDDLILRTELIKLRCSVATVAIKDKQSVRAYCTRLCMSVEVLHPLKAKLICCPAVVADSDSPVWWKVLVPAGLVELPRQDYERWETPAGRVDTLNRCDPVAIARLNDSSSTNSVRARDNL